MVCALVATATADDPAGALPTAADGRALNLGFEDGTLRDWTAEGPAFAGQPVEGDLVAARRSDMKSAHAGRYWIGGFERGGDRPTGTLTSAPFPVTAPFASFLVAGGPHPETRVELISADDGTVLFRVSGDETEELKRVVVDLSKAVGRSIRVRLVDEHRGHWGHLNFDDFRFHAARPTIAARPGAPATPDEYAHAGLDPVAAAAAMTVPEGFQVDQIAGEPEVVQPIAMTIDDRGRLWVAEAYSYPKRLPDDQARDRILIFEDADADGKFETRKVFAEKLNLVSGLEVGFGGAWVGSAPHLLFLADADGDDRADGAPQVVLDGWGMEDTHETLNSFIWGPDGWLYGCHGVFTFSKVGAPGTPDADRAPLNAGIWRYHPTRKVFEVFAHGTSNPWGVDFNDNGRAFLTSCVIPHLYQLTQGGRYERQAGQHYNPYTYDDIKTIADHRHYVGANPHAGNDKSDSAGGGHAHAGAMIYLGGAWPAEYRGSMFMNNIHGARLNRDTLEAEGSGFVGRHAPDFLMANDRWSQLLYFRAGPDGNVYMIDWYDKNQCHRNEDGAHDRTNGRIFRVAYGDPKPARVDVGTMDERALALQALNSNEWFYRQARRRLQERGASAETRALLSGLAFGEAEKALDADGRSIALDEPRRLRALWMLHATGGLDDDQVARGLASKLPYVRAWTIQLASDGREPNERTLATLRDLAESDPSPVVRLYVAAALQRLPIDKRWSIAEALVAHGEVARDMNLPLMIWYAVEPLAEADPARAARLAGASAIPTIRSFMARRIAAIGTPEAIALMVDQLDKADRPARKLELLTAINQALQGRRDVEMPETWPAVSKGLLADTDARIRDQATALGASFGDPAALKALRATLNGSGPAPQRRAALAALVKARDETLPAVLRGLVADQSLRADAIRALAAFDDPETPAMILGVYSDLTPAERRDALNTLAARPASARRLLAAVGEKRVPAADLSADLVRQLRNLNDEALNALIAEHWGAVRAGGGDKSALIARYRSQIRRPYSTPGDPMLGRAVFAGVCAQCHTLFGAGSNVGPELTGSNRADLEYVLQNVLDPNELIGKDYQAHVVALTDGRVLTGLIRGEDGDALTLVTANETITVPKGDVEERRPSEASMMPDDLWAKLDEYSIRSLVAYLAAPAQVPMLATPENVAGFFNGKDLTGWKGDPALWSVENGEIVGRTTTGIDHNAFLVSDLAATDFRLKLKIKLVDDVGNSGIQLRSEALPDGEMRGYQADAGPGWWGKLYEENGRALLWDKTGEAHVKKGEWNDYTIEAVGSRVRTGINGQPCVDLDDPKGARRGVFALQLHSGGPTEVRFKDLQLEVVAPPAAPAATGAVSR